MNSPFPIAGAADRPIGRTRLPDWPRLMSAELAAAYVGISETTFRELAPVSAKAIGRRRLYDRKDLDRWADALDGQPLDAGEEESHKRDVERAWLESRKGRRP